MDTPSVVKPSCLGVIVRLWKRVALVVARAVVAFVQVPGMPTRFHVLILLVGHLGSQLQEKRSQSLRGRVSCTFAVAGWTSAVFPVCCQIAEWCVCLSVG